MSEVPPGWTTARLGDLGELRLGKMLDKVRNQGVPTQYLRNINVRWFRFDLTDLQIVLVSEDERELLSVQEGDLFICEGGEPGRCAVWRNGANSLVYQKALHRFRTSGGIVPELLMYRLRHDADSGALQDAFTGTTIKHLPQESLSRYEIPLPPINEQERIADKLDAVLARVDSCRERLDRVSAILKRFRQAVLAAATSGTLTEEWRDETRCSTEWRQTTVRSLLTDIRYGTAKKCFYEPKKTPVLRIPNVLDGRVSHEDVKYAEFEKEELGKLALAPGDILVIRSNGSLGLVGRTALVTEREEGFLYAGYLIRLRVNQALARPAYLSISLASPVSRDIIERVARSTSGVNNINAEEIKGIVISLPGVEEQDEIIQRVEALFAYADRLEARYTAARAQVERLTPALLAKAFRGELVPQDPNDEPASVLLDGIRAARAAMGEKPRQRTKTKRKPMTTKLTTDALKEIIRGLPTDRFTFNDLRGQVSADYETLKDVVFALLSEVPASIKQVFDAEAQTMMLMRVEQ